MINGAGFDVRSLRSLALIADLSGRTWFGRERRRGSRPQIPRPLRGDGLLDARPLHASVTDTVDISGVGEGRCESIAAYTRRSLRSGEAGQLWLIIIKIGG